MRKVLVVVLGSLIVSSAAFAQEPLPSSVAFPGSFWIAMGDVGPAEPDNTLGQAALEQGITVWREGSWFLVPFLRASVSEDVRGYDWNDKHPFTAGIKLQRRTANGIVHAGGGLLFEHDPATGKDHHPAAFAGYWTGWQQDGSAHAGRSNFALPGSLDVTTGILTGRDPRNWLSYVTLQQGVVTHRIRGVAAVPYTALRTSFDTKGRPWENRASADAGVKLVRAITGGVIEAGVAQRFQRELKTGRNSSAPVVFVNLWIGWNPSSVSIR